MDFRKLVLDKIEAVGIKDASVFFGVSVGTASNWASGRTTPSLEAAQLAYVDAGFEDKPIREEIVMWEGKEVMIALPCYRTINPRTHFTLFANYARYGVDKLALEIKTRTVIHESRNILIDKALKNKSIKTVIMCDDDMILPCGSPGLINGRYGGKIPNELASKIAISQIMSHGRDKEIVGGLYFGRTEQGHAQCASAFTSKSDNETFHKLGFRGLRKEGWVATGFIKIEMTAIHKMKAAIDEGKWPELKPQRADRWYGFFTPLQVGIGEDVSFGRRAAEIGIQSYVDCDLICGHADGNYVWWNHNQRPA